MSAPTNVSSKVIVKPPRFHLPLWTWTHRAFQAIFLLALVWGASDNFWYIRGNIGATRVLDWIPLVDPLAALEITLARRAFSPTLWAAAGLILLLYIVLGRAFCAWACPLGLVLDLNDALRTYVNRKLRRYRRKLPQLTINKNTKYWVLAVTLVLSFVTTLPVFLLVSPINILSRAFIYGATTAIWLVVVLVVLEWFAPRIWCKSICPLGAFYSLVGYFSPIRVKIDQIKEQQGKQCGLCAYHCPMDIQIVNDHIIRGYTSIDDGECTRCGVCMDACPRGSLSLGFSWPWKK